MSTVINSNNLFFVHLEQKMEKEGKDTAELILNKQSNEILRKTQ